MIVFVFLYLFLSNVCCFIAPHNNHIQTTFWRLPTHLAFQPFKNANQSPPSEALIGTTTPSSMNITTVATPVATVATVATPHPSPFPTTSGSSPRKNPIWFNHQLMIQAIVETFRDDWNETRRDVLESFQKAQTLVNVLPKVGIPLNILAFVFTTAYHHGDGDVSILNPSFLFLEYVIGLYTYGYDKFIDAKIYNQTLAVSAVTDPEADLEADPEADLETDPDLPLPEDSLFWPPHSTNPEPSESPVTARQRGKIALYKTILANPQFYTRLFILSKWAIEYTLFLSATTEPSTSALLTLLFEFTKKVWGMGLQETPNLFPLVNLIFLSQLWTHDAFFLLPFLTLVEAAKYYVPLKAQFPSIKPFLVSSFWVGAVYVLPIALQEHSLGVVFRPEEYLPPFLLISSLSNVMDIVDVEEDRDNQIATIPVRWGPMPAAVLSAILFVGFLQTSPPFLKDFFEFVQRITKDVFIDHNYGGIHIVKFISSFLPLVNNVGHNVLHLNEEFINFVVDNPHIDNTVKSHVILSFIKMAQMGDNAGTYMLQWYFDFVRFCFHHL